MPAAVSGVSRMPTYARRQIVVEDTVGVYHCIARCVRRAFLCGVDPYTGQDYIVNTKEWILDRMRELAGRLFKQAAGRSSSLVDAAARRSRRSFQGKAAARTAFVS